MAKLPFSLSNRDKTTPGSAFVAATFRHFAPLQALVLGLGLTAACANPASSSPGDGDGDIAGDGDSSGDGDGDGDGDGNDDIDIGNDPLAGTGGSGPDEGDPCLGPMPPADCELDYEPSGPGCGDGEINAEGEECDDGNGLPGDGCSGLCKIEPNYSCDESGCSSTIVCGNGETQPGEVCDDGNTEDGDGCSIDCFTIEDGYNCPSSGGECTQIDPCKTLSPPSSCFPPPGSKPYCGDGEINNLWEQCDDGNARPGDGCNGACAEEPNWNCDGAGACTSTIVCGDGAISGGEICDDGDTTDDNGCQGDCLSVTPGYTCDRATGICTEVDVCDLPRPPAECLSGTGGGGGGPTPYCGDGTVNQITEACDDGNYRPGDGCSGACKVEPNWNCDVPPCVPTFECGNGVREGTELCDDENFVSGDGCSDDCTLIDPYYVCPPSGGACTNTVACNDGRITGPEQCEDGDATGGDGCDENCQLEPGYYCPTVGGPCSTLPYCGDGNQTAGEQCDDAGSAAPGCDASCKIEAGYACPTPGADCIAITVICGNGAIEGEEQCDDGNTDSGDGCSASCVKDPKWTCPNTGEPCIPVCGDGYIVGDEPCDDDGTESGDGCSATCTLEPGYYCEDGEPTVCGVDICGNSEIGNDEACDDGNTRPGDGCAPDCTAEPDCSSYGAAGCTSSCGDGLLIDEECDDGNTKNGDGCSSNCTVEYGFTCEQPAGCGHFAEWDDDNDDGTPAITTCIMRVPVTYRDFNESHSDFQPGWDSAGTPNLVNATLNANGKPTWNSSNGDGFITSTTSFNQWYNDSAQSSTIIGELVLWDNENDGFVNRWGEEGERWVAGASAGNPGTNAWMWCGNKWGDLGSNAGGTCAMNSGGAFNNEVCNSTHASYIRCVATSGGEPNGSNEVPFGDPAVDTWYAEYLQGYQPPTEGTEYDGTPVFYPLDYHPDALTPTSGYAAAGIAPAYGGSWDAESNYVPSPGVHNFHFTSEVRQWFKYDSTQSYTLDFTGDDDVWVFINGQLAVDLGGWHPPQDGTLQIDAGGAITLTENGTITNTNVGAFGMVDGNVYEIVVFQAERKFSGSSYRLTLAGFNTNPSICTSTCGDGLLASSEECDDGVNDGGYGECQPGCMLGSFCGDGVPDSGEECDNGLNLSGWNDTTPTACAPGCVLPSYCGDGEVDADHELCDEGMANASGQYGGCTDLCLFGPYCGDGQVQGGEGEQCDDGVNDGSAGCGPDCQSTISCGNGQLDPGEECDDGVNDGGYGECQPGCFEGPYCGDGYADSPQETCDDGTNDGTYGGCSPVCQYGPFCGDGIVNGDEDCDDEDNDGGYGECGPGCQTGSYCGDGQVNGPEECDDGTNDGTITACQGGCVWGPYCGDGSIDTDDGEVCDDGSNLGGYNKCAPGCEPGPYCGDGDPQSPYEECDDGQNDGGYGECATGCQLGPYCGDGEINGGETCDDAVNNGAYGRCAPDCTTGSYCGDGIQQPEEQCDDGTNDGEVSSCQPGCVLGPGCGDGLLQEGEECDFGPANSTSYDGCNSCKWGPRCGDGVIQSTVEQCDDGTNPGGYGQCAQNCRFGPYCGDSVVNGSEICDDGVNDGGYGQCAPACKLGPYCGDGKLDSDNEQCDDGNRKNGDGCSASCYREIVVQ